MKAFAIGAYVKVRTTGRRGTVATFFDDGLGWHYVIHFLGIPRGQYDVLSQDQIEEASNDFNYPRIPLSGDWAALA